MKYTCHQHTHLKSIDGIAVTLDHYEINIISY